MSWTDALGKLKLLQLAFWLRVGAVAVCAGIVAGAVLVERNNRETALTSAEDHALTMATSLAQHAGDTFQIADVALTSMGRLIGADAPTRSQLAALRLDMAELLLRVPRLSSLAYYEQSGWLLATSDKTVTNPVNQSQSTLFQHHRQNPDAGLWIGPPARPDARGPWLLTASRRISHEDGSFGGVLVATIQARYFADFYATFQEAEGSRVVLMGFDGKLLARSPYDAGQIGRDLSNTAIFLDVQGGASVGKQRMTSPIDGVERLSAYHRVAGQAVTIIFSVSRAAAIAQWQEGLFARSVTVAVLIVLVAFGGWRLAAYAETRLASEANLLEISRTDALTGLLNRRAFDHVSQMEWLRCVASGKPLSLLMIDVDHFKAFNDRHGHPSGDECLQVLARAIRNSAHFPLDRVMRYGGEEIVVVLPDTPSEQAFVVAERIRKTVEGIQLSFLMTPLPHVTVSIGYATEDRRSRIRSGQAQLLADADRALYAAKVDGRNRVVSADGAVSDEAEASVAQPLTVIATSMARTA